MERWNSKRAKEENQPFLKILLVYFRTEKEKKKEKKSNQQNF